MITASPTPVAAAATQAQRTGPGVRSSDAGNLADQLLRAAPAPRRAFLAELAADEPRSLAYVLREVRRATGTLYGLYADDPVGFVEDVLGESLWSRQRDVLAAIRTHKRVAVPAGFGVGKTHLAARAAVWFCNVHPPGTGLVVTTATRFRQVQRQLWPHIRKIVPRAGLPGTCDTVQYKIPDEHGQDVVAAYGFTAPPGDEAAMQGIHYPHLLLIVDEAGGIARTIGAGTNNLLTGGDARMLAIGNPPTDDPRSWFERLCEDGDDPEKPGVVTIPIAAIDSPAITGEDAPLCRDCPPVEGDEHTVSRHMPDDEWVDNTLREYGPEHPYVVAKVYAKFPRDAGNKTIPLSWVEAARDIDDIEWTSGAGDWVRIRDLGLKGETADHFVARGSWVRLGVDVAADGGDEVAIYRAVGDAIEFRHASSGSVNSSQVKVAERVLEEIHAAQRLAKALGSKAAVRVKVDKNGLGHGVTSMLERWAENGRHQAEIVGVMVSEKPERADPGAAMRPRRKRDEMWLAGRGLLLPDPSTGIGRIRLRTDEQCAIQLTAPDLQFDSAGFTVVESKKSMRARGVSSPDRAEAALLAIYEPDGAKRRKGGGLVV